jgi:GGDEF domain-containing protein
MFTVEAHVYGRGHAYRQGGDEYLVLLPNSSRDEAARILSALQIKLHDLHFGDLITDKLTTSIGLCAIDADCHLTDCEVLEAVNRAEAHAKQSGRSCIATYAGTRYRAEDLVLAGGDAGPGPSPAP